MNINPDSITIPRIAKADGTVFRSLEGTRFMFNRANWPSEFPDCRPTTVTAAHDGINLYLLFECTGPHLKAEVTEDLGPVANDSCVEFFVSPKPETGRYWNFEFNAIGRKNVSTRIERPNPRRLSRDELELIQTFPSVGTEPIAERDGIHAWSLGVIIPLSLIGVEYTGKPVEMRGNFYKCGGKTASPHYISCGEINTPKPDFHRPEFFIPVILE